MDTKSKPEPIEGQSAEAVALPPSCSPANLSHAELLRLIGEIDGIDLEGHGGRLFVNLRIGGKTIELISDSGENPSHHITREGIRAVLSQANAATLARAAQGVDPATD